MTSDRLWSDVQRVLESLGDVDPDDLPSKLDALCGADSRLGREIEAILSSDDGLVDVAEIVTDAARQVVSEEDPLLDTRLGPYRITRRLGEGGMSVVYLAARDDDTFERAVCVKVMKRGLDTDALLRRFETERRILANLDHPNIARLYDGSSTSEGRPYFVMEHVDGVPIDEYVRSRDLSVDRCLRLFRIVCGAVDHAHQRLIVHRDLKPHNILVTEAGSPKLLDFGIAKLLGGGDTGLTQTADAFLTPDYASPEQIRGEPISTASDQYSLAVLLYVMLTGRRPYEVTTSDRSAMERAVADASVARPSTLRGRIPRDLDHIVLKAMRPDESDRYESVHEFSDDVDRYLTGLPVRARRGTWRYRAGKFLRRSRMKVTVGVLVLTLLTVLGLQTLRLTHIRTRAETVARQLSEMAVVADREISFVEAPSTPALEFGRGSFTLSAWVRMTGRADQPVIIMDKRIPPYHFSRGFVMFVYADRLGLQIADGVRVHAHPSGTPTQTTGSTFHLGRGDLGDGAWHHVAASVHRDTLDASQNNVTLYVDGEPDYVSSANYVRTGDVSCPAPLRVGVECDGFQIARPFTGSIRHPQVFGRAIGAEEMRRRFAQGHESLNTDVYHLPEFTIADGDSIAIPLVIENLGSRPASYTWTASGLPGDNGHPPLSRFEPASGNVILAPGPSSVAITIGMSAREIARSGSGSFQVSVVNVESLEPVIRSGQVMTAEWARQRGVEPTPPYAPNLRQSGTLEESELDSGIPLALEVRVRPNGFITDASVAFDVGLAPRPMRMEVVALSGEVIRSVDLGTMSIGQHSVAWDGRDDDGNRVPSGHYAIDIIGRRSITRWDPDGEEWIRPEESGSITTRVVYLP